ncbi:hypothetical protein KUTeg_009388 [Tegillarca granosa]|uniref:Impact N-terminal domain-containing protein n=1 Tax=Tegillarca granosa TaxID=220873 RepID=A0ABQ9F8S3_TEGGR|nr:hypothetical protein KUTeg_009388 [Tegillarca granosa]
MDHKKDEFERKRKREQSGESSKTVNNKENMASLDKVQETVDNASFNPATSNDSLMRLILDVQLTVNKINNKFDAQNEKVDELANDIHRAGGVEDRLQCVIDESDHIGSVVNVLQEQNKLLIKEMSIMKGYIEKLENRVESQQKQITDIIGRNMRENLIINGLKEEENENLKEKFEKFVKVNLGIKDNIRIDRIHRFGQKQTGKSPRPRSIVAKFHDYNEKEGNEFTGRAVTTTTYQETREALKQILRDQLIIRADHNITVYRFTDKDGRIHDGFDDDGEFGAGSTLLKYLQENNVTNKLVVVSRVSGEKLGPLSNRALDKL